MRVKFHSNIESTHRRSRNELRRRLELVRGRLHLLGPSDRVLMELYLEHGTSPARIATLLGTSEATVARRIQRLLAGLADGVYITALRNRSRFRPAELKIIRDHFLLGLSQEQITAKRACSKYTVRKCLTKARRLAENPRDNNAE